MDLTEAKNLLKIGLEQLSKEALQRLADHKGPILLTGRICHAGRW